MRIEWEIEYEGAGIGARIPGTNLEGIVMENWETTPMSWDANVHEYQKVIGGWENPSRKTHVSLPEIIAWVEE